MSIEKKIIKPRDVLLEKVAGELAATWFEAGLNTPGMDMLRKKYKNDPRKFARMNLEKFIPTAVNILIGMLNRPDIAAEMKEEIYDCLMDRINDPTNVVAEELTALPNLDIAKVIEMNKSKQDEADKKIAQLLNPEAHKNIPPVIKATRH